MGLAPDASHPPKIDPKMYEISDPPKGGPKWTHRFKVAFVAFCVSRGLKKEAPGVYSKVGPIWGRVWDPQKWRKHCKWQQKSTFQRYPKVSLLGSIWGALWEP